MLRAFRRRVSYVREESRASACTAGMLYRFAERTHHRETINLRYRHRYVSERAHAGEAGSATRVTGFIVIGGNDGLGRVYLVSSHTAQDRHYLSLLLVSTWQTGEHIFHPLLPPPSVPLLPPPEPERNAPFTECVSGACMMYARKAAAESFSPAKRRRVTRDTAIRAASGLSRVTCPRFFWPIWPGTADSVKKPNETRGAVMTGLFEACWPDRFFLFGRLVRFEEELGRWISRAGMSGIGEGGCVSKFSSAIIVH